MKASELRIGNYVMFARNHKICIVSELNSSKHIGATVVDYHGSTIRRGLAPIPLTEEWLLRFGFKFDGHIYEGSEKLRQNSNKDIGVKFQAYFFNKRLNRWMDCQTRVCVDYVHQLQNLYFALTGEELTLNASNNE